MDQLLDELGIARLLGITPRRVLDLAKEGAIPAIDIPKVGLRFRKEDIDNWIDRLSTLEVASKTHSKD